jgi:hypothetical protein
MFFLPDNTLGALLEQNSINVFFRFYNNEKTHQLQVSRK